MSYVSKNHYPNTTVYINKFNVRDQETLNQLELRYSGIRQSDLLSNPITDGKFDLKHLQKIHKYLFQDVYPFAGKIRNEQIQKGYTQFANPLYIESFAKDIFRQLKEENYLKGLPKDKMADRLAFYMGEINMCHPALEGNGRTNREFIRTLALSNGYTLDWRKIDKHELTNATIQAIVDHKPLGKLLEQGILENEPSQEIIKDWKRMSEQDMELE